MAFWKKMMRGKKGITFQLLMKIVIGLVVLGVIIYILVKFLGPDSKHTDVLAILGFG